MSKSEKLVTQPLKRWIYYAIGLKNYVEVEKEDAKQIEKVDFDRAFTHVQFCDLETGLELKLPKVWNINDWNSDYEVHKAKKKRAAINRIKWDITAKNLNTIALRCSELFGLPYEDAKTMALLIWDKPQAIKNLGIELAVFDESMIPKDV